MKNKVLKIGFDIHGVANVDGAFFSELTRLLVANGHEVHILTGSEKTPELERYLKSDLGLSWTHFFSIVSHCRELGATIEMIQGKPYVDENLWDRAKGEYCRQHGIDLHLDDSAVYGRHFNTPYAKYFKSRQGVEKKKIAVIGGSFNPVTHAHVMMAEAVLDALPQIHQVWMMPAYRHPFEKHKGYSSYRIRMIRLVETRRIRYFGYEIDHRLSGVTYMTFSRLLDDPDYSGLYEFHMVIGADCVFDFDAKWQHAEELAARVPFIIVPRPGYDLDRYHGLLSRPPHVILSDAKIPDISATDVRARIAAGASIREMVPPAVASFIQRHRLYKETGDCSMGSTEPADPLKTIGEDMTEPVAASCTHPSVFVNIAVCTLKDDAIEVLLTRRSQRTDADCWAIPGGPLEMTCEEDLAEIAVRKLEAETGLRDIYIEQLKTYGSVGESCSTCRITVAYFVLVPYERLSGLNISGTDEAAAEWIPLKDYAKALDDRGMVTGPDQDRILRDLMVRIQGKISYTPIAFELVPDKFTWPELRKVYEIVLDKRLDAANFKRKIRSMYRIRELKVRGQAYSVGRPPKRLKFQGVKDIYI